MKKTGIVFSILTIAMLLAACASAPPPAEPAPPPVEEEKPAKKLDLPDFLLNPPVYEDQVVGIGIAKMSNLNMSRTTATMRARADIAYQMSSRVESMLTDYFQEAGSGDDTQSITFVESISKQITEFELKGAKSADFYLAEDGTVYQLVLYPKGDLISEVNNLFERNETAAFAEFKADEALRRLDANLETDPLMSEGRSE